MAAYNTRAVVRPAGYYRSLNSQSTADIYDQQTCPNLASSSQLYDDAYEVERLVSSRRNRKGGAEYLVLWAGYRKEEATWVKEEDITFSALQDFYAPQPVYRRIADSVSYMTTAIGRSLKLGVNRGSHFSFDFPTDVFQFLFNNKGTNPEHGSGRLYALEDFGSEYFPTDWFKVYDKLGDGCEIDFPIRMCSRIKWSSTVYVKSRANVVAAKPKHYEEICVVWLVKRRCN